MRLDAILFDYDGTLVDSESVHFRHWNKVLAPYGVRLSFEEYRDGFAGVPTPTNARDLVGRYGVREDPVRLAELKVATYRDWLRTETVPAVDGAREVLARLRTRGLRLALVTGSKYHGVKVGLERLGLRSYFHSVVTKDDVREPKPHPESYRLALDRLGLPAAACVAVEDTATGLQAATGAGLACVAVRNAFSSTHDFSAAAAVVDSLSEASAWILARLDGVPAGAPRQ